MLSNLKSSEWVSGIKGDGQVVFYSLQVDGASAEYPERCCECDRASERATIRDTAQRYRLNPQHEQPPSLTGCSGGFSNFISITGGKNIKEKHNVL